MSTVIIDGVEYQPKSSIATPSIGVAITTHNRNEQLTDIISKWRKFTPDSIPIFVVDDASKIAVKEASFRFDNNVGIATAKNKSIELLMDAGIQHLFLADDDVHPITEDWWKPYVDSSEPHMSATFTHWKNGRAVGDCEITYDDGKLIGYSHARGMLIYTERHVIDTVGGMDTVFGKWGEEHIEWSDRIYHAGLTSLRYSDVPKSCETIWFANDYHTIGLSSNPDLNRGEQLTKNAPIRKKRRLDRFADYVEYRTQRNVVIAGIWNSQTDPQRPNTKMHTEQCKPLFDSVVGADKVFFTNDDSFSHKDINVIVKPMAVPNNPYHTKHISAYQYLISHPEIEYAFVVDANDVVMLNSPWDKLDKTHLYVGYESKPIDIAWMVNNFKQTVDESFLTDNLGRTLLNVGVIGGHRNTLIAFYRQMLADWEDISEIMDMGVFNKTAYSSAWRDRIIWGPTVTTVFKAEERNAVAWFKHK